MSVLVGVFPTDVSLPRLAEDDEDKNATGAGLVNLVSSAGQVSVDSDKVFKGVVSSAGALPVDALSAPLGLGHIMGHPC